jgi:hypothetical protein
MLGVPPPNKDRFLAAIAERIAPDRVQALYLFAPIRQGAVETGVAVLACEPERPQNDVTADGVTADSVTADSVPDDGVSPGVPAPEFESAPVPMDLRIAVPIPRPVVITARYRHTLKGADRGKWEFEIHEQADAPLATLERVMQGVQQRLDEQNEPELLDADVLRVALAEGVWTPPAR